MEGDPFFVGDDDVADSTKLACDAVGTGETSRLLPATGVVDLTGVLAPLGVGEMPILAMAAAACSSVLLSVELIDNDGLALDLLGCDVKDGTGLALDCCVLEGADDMDGTGLEGRLPMLSMEAIDLS